MPLKHVKHVLDGTAAKEFVQWEHANTERGNAPSSAHVCHAWL